jgi:hypothetical protein
VALHAWTPPQPISRSPFQELNLSNGLRTQPDAFLHLLGSEFIAPTRLVRIRRISEGIVGETR